MHHTLKIRLLLVVVAFLATWPLFAAAQGNPDVASKILASEDKWNAAYKRSDIATMESLLAEDFIITLEDGRHFQQVGLHRAQWRLDGPY